MLLKEMFDKPQKVLQWDKKGNTDSALFKADDHFYELEFHRDGKDVGVEFSYIDMFGGIVRKQGVQNTGVSVKVFATIISLVKKWVEKNKPENIFFVGSGVSRNKLYKRLVNKFAQAGGYDYKTKHDEFYLARK